MGHPFLRAGRRAQQGQRLLGLALVGPEHAEPRRGGHPVGPLGQGEGLAEQCAEAGDADGVQARLVQARALLAGELVFGWRLELRHQLITGRLALLRGDAEAALAAATEVETRAGALGVPRYLTVARVLARRARGALGLPVDLDALAADLDRIEGAVAVEAWWWTGEAAADFAVPAWLDVAAKRAERLARQAGDYAETLRRAAGRRLDGWRALSGR